MEMIHEYAKYIYAILIVLNIGILILLLAKLSKVFKTLGSYQPELVSISSNLDEIEQKSHKISETAEAFRFFMTIIGMSRIAHQFNRNYKKNNSLTKSIAKTTVTNSKVVKTLENRAFDALYDKLMNY